MIRMQTAFVPKEEIRQVLMKVTKRKKWNELGEVFLIGINYDTKTKEHQCLIENMRSNLNICPPEYCAGICIVLRRASFLEKDRIAGLQIIPGDSTGQIPDSGCIPDSYKT